MKRFIDLEVLVANAIIEIAKETNQRLVTKKQLKRYEQFVIAILNSNQKQVFSPNEKYDFERLTANYPFFKIYQDNSKLEYLFLAKEKTIADLKHQFRSSLDISLLKAFINSSSLKALQIEQGKAFEIERKFLITDLPSHLKVIKKKEIGQTYLSLDPEISIRKEDDEYFLIKKGNGFIKRAKYLEPLSEKQFHLYFNDRITCFIYKTRYYVLIYDGLLTATVDFYHRQLEGLKIAEVEFSNMEMADAFKPPNWFEKEVSNDMMFKNSYLAEYCTMQQMINLSPIKQKSR